VKSFLVISQVISLEKMPFKLGCIMFTFIYAKKTNFFVIFPIKRPEEVSQVEMFDPNF